MRNMKVIPLVQLVEWVGKNRVRVFFSTGRTSEIRLPVRSARSAKIVDMGMGIDPGDGKDVSSLWLYERGRVLCEGRRGLPIKR